LFAARQRKNIEGDWAPLNSKRLYLAFLAAIAAARRAAAVFFRCGQDDVVQTRVVIPPLAAAGRFLFASAVFFAAARSFTVAVALFITAHRYTSYFRLEGNIPTP
jgi:hypothetical protein